MARRLPAKQLKQVRFLSASFLSKIDIAGPAAHFALKYELAPCVPNMDFDMAISIHG